MKGRVSDKLILMEEKLFLIMSSVAVVLLVISWSLADLC